MSDYNVSSRYAQALMQLAKEKNNVDSVADDMHLIYNTLEGSKELRAILKSPIVKDLKKKDILKQIFSEKINSDSLNFIVFLVDKNRETYIQNIVKTYLAIKDKEQGIVNVAVKSADDLNDDQKVKLNAKLEEITKKSVRLSLTTDKNLIGGFLVRVDDTVYDASVKRQLELLKNSFLREN